MIFHHIPVLFQPVINLIAEHGPRRIIDATIGGAGHARGLLERLPEAQLLGIDRDDDAIAAATENLEPFKDRATIRKGVFSDMKAIAASIGWDHADAVLMDIGVSSHQIDDPERGFSFRMDGPLDMRMNRQEDTMTAATLLNTASQEELETIIRDFGEEFKASSSHGKSSNGEKRSRLRPPANSMNFLKRSSDSNISTVFRLRPEPSRLCESRSTTSWTNSRMR